MVSHPTHLLCDLDPQEVNIKVILLAISPLLNGGLLTLGAICIFFLVSFTTNPQESSSGHPSPKLKQFRFWTLYIPVLLVLNIALMVLGVWQFLFMGTNATVTEGMVLISGLTLSLTDGVLVWRCHKVQSLALGFHQGKLAYTVMRLLPQFFYFIALAAGLISIIERAVAHSMISVVTFEVALVSNALLNIYATSFISIHLLLFRKVARACHPADLSGVRQSRWLIQNFLEGAVINVPLVLTAIILSCIGNSQFRDYLAFIGIPCQSFSTLLILHQMVLGKAIGHAEETKKPE